MAERSNVWKAVFLVVLTIDFGISVLERVRTVVVHIEALIQLFDWSGLDTILLGENASLLVEHCAVQAHLHSRREVVILVTCSLIAARRCR